MPRIRGFPPIIGRQPRVLVLGSMPSEASLAAGQYYGLPRNAFWPIMGELFGAGPELAYAERRRILESRGIAVWDVLAECERNGSLDSAIRLADARTNDLPGFLRRHRSIRVVFFNGGLAARLYRRRILPDVALQSPYLRHYRLPSTSPAMAAMDFTAKLAAWRAVAEAAGGEQALAARPGLRPVG